jgi:cyanophycinase
MPARRKTKPRRLGRLLAIGGNEDKSTGGAIVQEVVRQADGGLIVVATVASRVPDQVWEMYEHLFRKLGAKDVAHMDTRTRTDSAEEEHLELLARATMVFFSGGDQFWITSKLGGTKIWDAVHAVYDRGGIIAGTSAGATAMSEQMLVSGDGQRPPLIGGPTFMAPGLALLKDVTIDQHFSQRGRIGRLIAAVAQNPRMLGLGIDEDTAALIDEAHVLRVIGTGAVYVVDGHGMSYSNVSQRGPSSTVLTACGLGLHVLSPGSCFDIGDRKPLME